MAAAITSASLQLLPMFQNSAIAGRLAPSIRMACQVLHEREIRIANFGCVFPMYSASMLFQAFNFNQSMFSTIANARTQPLSPAFDQQPSSVAVPAAYQLLGKGHMYLDVRTCEEFNAGHPTGAVNIPYLLNKGADMSKNPKFLDEVSSKFNKQEEILVGCQSGRRSLMAAADMQTAGFTSVVDVAGGYNSWVQNGLPTTTK
ncbi:Thiosulfate sulfurtransferase 16, chloroplastic [Linum grandiflorum]